MSAPAEGQAAPAGSWLRARSAGLLAIAAGVAVELIVTAVSGRSESWDAPQYWPIGYPALIVVSGLLGWCSPRGAWRWGPAAMLSQFATMLARKDDWSLAPLGLILALVASLPCILVARLAAAWRLRRAGAGG